MQISALSMLKERTDKYNKSCQSIYKLHNKAILARKFV